MNRLHHIKKTLPKNIEDNKLYPNVEFVLLDYNSSDGLEEWVKTEMKEHLASGVLKFYRTTDNPYFDRSHSRNMVYKLATGEVICNVDADNYTGNGFAEFINKEFNKDEHVYLVADTKKRFYFLRNAFGRFCVKRDVLLELGGLDEEMKSYGSETMDLYARLDKYGLKESVIKNTEFLSAISHGDEERISNEYFLNSLEAMYINFISHESSEFIVLYKNGTYDFGGLVPELEETHLPAALKKGSLQKGEWVQNDQKISFSTPEREVMKGVFEGDDLIVNQRSFYKMSDLGFLMGVAKSYSFITNNEKMNENLSDKSSIVNHGVFGKGKVIDVDSCTVELV